MTLRSKGPDVLTDSLIFKAGFSSTSILEPYKESINSAGLKKLFRTKPRIFKAFVKAVLSLSEMMKTTRLPPIVAGISSSVLRGGDAKFKTTSVPSCVQ